MSGGAFRAGVAGAVVGGLATAAACRRAHGSDACVAALVRRVVHDVNNQLAVIAGFTETLMSSFADGDPRRGDAQRINDATGRAAELCAGILARVPRAC